MNRLDVSPWGRVSPRAETVIAEIAPRVRAMGVENPGRWSRGGGAILHPLADTRDSLVRDGLAPLPDTVT